LGKTTDRTRMARSLIGLARQHALARGGRQRACGWWGRGRDWFYGKSTLCEGGLAGAGAMPLVDAAVGLVVLVVAGAGLWYLFSTLGSGNWRDEE
jgi:hypothetical protein